MIAFTRNCDHYIKMFFYIYKNTINIDIFDDNKKIMNYASITVMIKLLM